jgi:GR25 family glycosyltransferase involved in LPS biosynthesis
MDSIIVINLDRRPDRWALVKSEVERFGKTPIRLSATDGRTLDIDISGNISGFKKRNNSKEHYYRGTAGCYFSHIRALELAFELGGGGILILEDDVVIESLETPDVSDKIIQLGGLPNPGSDVFYGAHAIYFPNTTIVKEFLDYAKSHPNSIDSIYVRFARAGKLHYHQPFTIHQRQDYSDILCSIRTSV